MSRKIKKCLEEIAGERAPGPAPTFSVFHVLRVIEIVAENPVGRGKLAEKLKVGEGAVRTIVNRLKKAGLLLTSKAGCKLTVKGLRLWREYKKIFEKKVEIKEAKLMSTPYNFAILAKNCGDKVKSGMEQRDAAVRVGAKGATTIVFKGGRLIVPSVSDNFSRDYPSTAEKLTALLKPEENDVIVIVGADTLYMAEYGAVAAAWTLLNDC